jgi:hypothetical protein
MTPVQLPPDVRSLMDSLEAWARSSLPLWTDHQDYPTFQRTNTTTMLIRQDGWEATFWYDLTLKWLRVRITGNLGEAEVAIMSRTNDRDHFHIRMAVSEEVLRHAFLAIKPSMPRKRKGEKKQPENERAPSVPQFANDYKPRIKKVKNV